LAALLWGVLGAAINYATHRWAPLKLARVVLALSMVPMIGLLIYCAAALGLAIKTNDMRYFGADMVFGIALIATLIWVPSAYAGARFGRANREP
jgi:surface polysaccharide O-acyltransferase-like enzyme